jgi:hypothetical protein
VTSRENGAKAQLLVVSKQWLKLKKLRNKSPDNTECIESSKAETRDLLQAHAPKVD